VDKLAVKVIKAKKGLDPFYYIRGLLVTNYLYYKGSFSPLLAASLRSS